MSARGAEEEVPESGPGLWEAVGRRFFRPARPGLDEACARAAAHGLAVIADAERSAGAKLNVTQRRELLQRREEVASLWEALAPVGWGGGLEMSRFRGPRPTPHRRGGPERFQEVGEWPMRAEDVVALVADASAVDRCNLLMHEAAARMDAVGLLRWGKPRVIEWCSVQPKYVYMAEAILNPGSFSVRNRVGFVPSDGAASPQWTESAGIQHAVAPRWSIEGRSMTSSMLRAARYILSQHEGWVAAAAAGRKAGWWTDDRDLRPSVVGTPLSRLKNPVAPLVQVLLEGYVPGWIDKQNPGAGVVFPRLDFAAKSEREWVLSPRLRHNVGA